MKHWQQHNIEERIHLIRIAYAKTSLPIQSIEKDWWVTMVLKALSLTQYASLMSFKGGTSLSKGWNVIKRFSEDIDIALRREGPFAISGTSKSQLTKLRKAARHYVIRELPGELDSKLRELGVSDFTVESQTERDRNGEKIEIRVDTHPSVIFVKYKSVLPGSAAYVDTQVKIEISCLSMDEPVEDKTITSFISDATPSSEDVSVVFKTVVPTRTFLEKMFLLHEEFQKDHPRSKRMTRHLYDLEKLMDTRFGREALANRKLYEEVVRHRSVFNNIPYVDYSLHAPQTISFVPPESQMEAWRNDYEQTISNFFYPGEVNLTFDGLIARIRELQDRVRGM